MGFYVEQEDGTMTFLPGIDYGLIPTTPSLFMFLYIFLYLKHLLSDQVLRNATKALQETETTT